jgi:excisionase family DNA binding protein
VSTQSPDGEAEQPMSVSQVAGLFRVNPPTVNRWAKSGRLPAFRTPGGRFRFPAAAVRALLKRQGDAAD